MSNGWNRRNDSNPELWATQKVNWLRMQDPAFTEAQQVFPLTLSDDAYLLYGDEQIVGSVRTAYYATALAVSALSDDGENNIYLLNPQVVTPEGEWEAWHDFVGGGPLRYRSFWDLMQAQNIRLRTSLA